MWRALAGLPIQHYLDVSSPRLFPIFFLGKRPGITAELVNPDRKDLHHTAALIRACGLEERCQFRNCLIEDAPFAPESFDAITSISVVEHIPRDQEAVRKMWELLRPGGKLLLSVPCAAVAEEEFVDVDFFGLQNPDDAGFFFHQYIYDQSLLEEKFYSVAGSPTQISIFGEKKVGTLLNGLLKKWSGQEYPLWKEPYIMAREFQRYDAISDLPGLGVIALEFVKR